jgi:hypothetical protein
MLQPDATKLCYNHVVPCFNSCYHERQTHLVGVTRGHVLLGLSIRALPLELLLWIDIKKYHELEAICLISRDQAQYIYA